MKKYELSITRGNCADWTVENAIREFCQNHYDAPEEGEVNYEEGVLTITTYNTTLPTKTLLIGCSTKRGDEDTVGGKGEGYKVATGILLREGLSVEILNGPVKWTPCYEYNPTYDEDILVFYEQSLSFNEHLSFVVTGVTEEVWENVKNECLYLQEDVGDFLAGTTGTLLKDASGKIFVGGLFVYKDSSLHFSYDFHPSVLKLNRDRKSVDNWDLKRNTATLCEEVLPKEELVALIKLGIPDVSQGSYLYGEEVRSACFEDFIKEHEGCTLAEYESDKEELSNKYEAKPIIHNSALFASLTKGSGSYYDYLGTIQKEDYEEDTRDPTDILDDFQSKYSFEMTKEGGDMETDFQELLDLFKSRGVRWDD